MLIHPSFGGYDFTPEMREALLKRGLTEEEIMTLEYSGDIEDRANPMVISAFQSCSPKQVGDLVLKMVPTMYLKTNSVEINEYDGLESLIINYDHHAVEEIKALDNLDPRVQAILSEPKHRPK